MRTLSRHLMARQLVFFAGATFAFLAVGTILDILVHLDRVVEQSDAAGGLLRCLMARVGARYGGDALPAASFAASFVCIGLATRAGETTACRACGISPAGSAAPILGLAAVLALATFWFNETWLLDARRTSAVLESELRSLAPGRGPFWYHSGNALYNVAPAPTPAAAGELTVYELDERGRVVTATRTRGARTAPARWQSLAAVRTRFDPERPATGFGREALPAGSVSLPEAAFRSPERNTWSLRELREPSMGGAGPSQTERTEFQRRLAGPATVFLFAGLALPLGLAVRRGLAGPALVGALLLAGFHAVDASALMAASRGALPAATAPWLAPALLTMGIGVAWLTPRAGARVGGRRPGLTRPA